MGKKENKDLDIGDYVKFFNGEKHDSGMIVYIDGLNKPISTRSLEPGSFDIITILSQDGNEFDKFRHEVSYDIETERRIKISKLL